MAEKIKIQHPSTKRVSLIFTQSFIIHTHQQQRQQTRDAIPFHSIVKGYIYDMLCMMYDWMKNEWLNGWIYQQFEWLNGNISECINGWIAAAAVDADAAAAAWIAIWYF